MTTFFTEEFLTNSDTETWQNHFDIEFFTDSNTASYYNLKLTNVSSGAGATFNQGLVIGNQEFEKPTFSIYPNPAKDKLYIENESLAIRAVQVFNLQGKQVLQQKELIDKRIQIQNLTKGMYILQIETNQGKFHQKFIKE